MHVKLDPVDLDSNNAGYLRILRNILGKHAGQTPEKIVFTDPVHFYRSIVPQSDRYFSNVWKERVRLVNRATRDFVSELPCSLCPEPATQMIVNRHGGPCSRNRIYCAEHVRADDIVEGALYRGDAREYGIRLPNVGRKRPFRKRALIKLIAECMGFDLERRFTDNYLCDGIDRIIAQIESRTPPQPQHSGRRSLFD
jgi:hypothetical protein